MSFEENWVKPISENPKDFFGGESRHCMACGEHKEITGFDTCQKCRIAYWKKNAGKQYLKIIEKYEKIQAKNN